jgi:hypothetical protein
MSTKLVPTFADRGCRVVGATGSHGRHSRLSRPEPLIIHSNTSSIYSRGWVDPVPDPLLLKKSGSAGNRTWDLWMCSQRRLYYCKFIQYLRVQRSCFKWHFCVVPRTFLECDGKSDNEWRVVNNSEWNSRCIFQGTSPAFPWTDRWEPRNPEHNVPVVTIITNLQTMVNRFVPSPFKFPFKIIILFILQHFLYLQSKFTVHKRCICEP